MIIQYNITVIGKVQKVWFRKYTLEKAQKLEIKGIVMNKNDGSVYIEAIGTKEILNKLLYWLKTEGSPLSNVSKVNYEIASISKEYTLFEIIR